jgi:hypothetical protein
MKNWRDLQVTGAGKLLLLASDFFTEDLAGIPLGKGLAHEMMLF